MLRNDLAGLSLFMVGNLLLGIIRHYRKRERVCSTSVGAVGSLDEIFGRLC